MAAVTRPRARWSDESGAELIEFAFALPLLLLIGLGIFDFGLLFQHYEVLTNAAREGARVAVLPGYDDGDVQLRVNDYLTAAGMTREHPAPVIDTTPTSINGHCVTMKKVTVTYPQTYWMVGGVAAYLGATDLLSRTTISATAQMRHEVAATGTCP